MVVGTLLYTPRKLYHYPSSDLEVIAFDKYDPCDTYNIGLNYYLHPINNHVCSSGIFNVKRVKAADTFFDIC